MSETTVQDVIAGFDDEQQEALYFVVGHALGPHKQKEDKHPRLMDLWLTFDDTQRMAFRFVVGSAAQMSMTDEDMERYIQRGRFE